MTRLFVPFVALALLLLVATPALAANPHFVVGPTITLNANNTVTATGSVAGVGNENLDVFLTADLLVEVICRNPAGNVAPGQTQETTVTGSVEDIRPENGRANFSVTTAAPTLSGTPKQLGCPNNKWSASIGDVTVSSATLQIFQGGVLVLSATETF
jgi:hypothetical protein